MIWRLLRAGFAAFAACILVVILMFEVAFIAKMADDYKTSIVRETVEQLKRDR